MVVDASDTKVRAVRIRRRVRINHPSPVDGAISLLTFNGDANCPCRRLRRSAASCERGEDLNLLPSGYDTGAERLWAQSGRIPKGSCMGRLEYQGSAQRSGGGFKSPLPDQDSS